MFSYSKILLFSLLLCGFSMQAQYAITGVVQDLDGKPLEDAAVEIRSLKVGVLSDEAGMFEIVNVPNGSYVVHCRILGLEEIKKEITINNGNAKVDFKFTTPAEIIDGFQLPSFSIISMPPIPILQVAVETTPVTSTNVSAGEIEELNHGQDLPYMLRFTPSAVVTSDAGTGVGYTGVRIRGSDQTRINVTINGVPLNDGESQNVFWVDLPDFASSVDNIQVQRGVGTSTNGAGAFGASIKLNTLNKENEPFGMVNNSVGSFNTFKHTVGFGTGLLGDHFSFEGRLSQITSDGYIDRASSDLKSYYLAGNYTTEKTTLQALVFGGNEVTYQSWYGTPESRVEDDEEAMLIHAQNNGLTAAQTDNLLNSGRTYNFYEYENQVDDYSQDHYQLHLNHKFSDRTNLSISGHYTYGRGYYEQFRGQDDLSDYGINPIFLNATQEFSGQTDEDGNPMNGSFESDYQWDEVEFEHTVVTDGNGDPITNPQGEVLLNSIAQITTTDLVRRRWLQNDFYGGIFNLQHTAGDLQLDFGGGYNIYDGDHYGELIWMEHSAGTDIGDLYYLNNGLKTDWNTYLKADYSINNKLNVYADLQVRAVQYEVAGIDADRREINTGDSLLFVNPKGGVYWRLTNNDHVYASVSVGQREPTRSDYIDAVEGAFPQPEKLTDYELGYKRILPGKYTFGLNAYYMDYVDQLVLTGALNDVGAPVRTNVAKSYRAGIEAQFGYVITKALRINANATFSQNRIEQFEEVLYDYTEDFDVIVNEYSETPIAFSPDLVAAGNIHYDILDRPNRNKLTFNWYAKYVGDQFLDNTGNSERMLDAYLVNDASLSFSLFGNAVREAKLTLMVNNVLDQLYSSNGYTYSYIYGETITENFLYPQAGRNFMCSLNLLF